jgi:hypothetical protein
MSADFQQITDAVALRLIDYVQRHAGNAILIGEFTDELNEAAAFIILIVPRDAR